MPSNMPEPADALAQLRELLVGQEIEDLARVKARLSDPAKRAEDLAQVLPEAIKSAKGRSLRDALEPIVEKTFQSSVRKNPKELADAIYPIMGPAIRSSIAAAIRDFAEALNQIVEKSVSLRSIRWRIEALITGKPFSQILLARSLLYSVEQIFLIHRKSGLLLQHAAAKGSVLKDADMISGMLTAVQDFLSDSFTEGGQDIETVDAGRFKLWLTYSPKLLLVGAVNGAAPVELKQAFRKALDGIEESLQSEINNFRQDDLSVFEPARAFLDACLLGQTAPEKRRNARLWPYFAVLAVIVAGVFGYQARQRFLWNRYFAMLKQQPGIVVTGIERQGSSYAITGFRDPGAPHPAGLLRSQGLDPGKATFDLHPYLSLNTPFAQQRELDTVKDSVETRIIRFDSGSSKLTPSEADRIDDITVVMKRLLAMRPDSRITITGRADETGDVGTNDKLSLERANRVGDALVAQGIARAVITIMAAGNRQPLRPGNTDWDLAVNRSVSFSVNTGSVNTGSVSGR
jgi:outer membrane protein OmpA-like peptidoglycan-associated protein